MIERGLISLLALTVMLLVPRSISLSERMCRKPVEPPPAPGLMKPLPRSTPFSPSRVMSPSFVTRRVPVCN